VQRVLLDSFCKTEYVVPIVALAVTLIGQIFGPSACSAHGTKQIQLEAPSAMNAQKGKLFPGHCVFHVP